jgi:hypothetical protein
VSIPRQRARLNSSFFVWHRFPTCLIQIANHFA